MRIEIGADRAAMALAAANDAALVVRDALDDHGTASVMLATGNSQFEFLDVLLARTDIDWSAVVGFHMDEYVGISADHPASFRRYMRERVVARAPFRAFNYIEGDAPDAAGECARYAARLRDTPLDLCCLGIGENGHLAFNDPPADFDDPLDVKVVELDERCRKQQVGEGHFPDVDAVPAHAITVTVPALLRAGHVIAIVPEARKAEPVAVALEGPVTPWCPASILQRYDHTAVYLDPESARLLTRS